MPGEEEAAFFKLRGSLDPRPPSLLLELDDASFFERDLTDSFVNDNDDDFFSLSANFCFCLSMSARICLFVPIFLLFESFFGDLDDLPVPLRSKEDLEEEAFGVPLSSSETAGLKDASGASHIPANADLTSSSEGSGDSDAGRPVVVGVAVVVVVVALIGVTSS